MNDRFKFRVYNKRTEEMLDVRLISYFSTGNICRVEAQNAVGDIKIFDDYKTSIENIELLQCTGLKDKNGKLIYEGDIIEFTDNVKINGSKTHIAKVEHREEFNAYMYHAECMGWYTINPSQNEVFKVKVIGNIYENEDLLKCENQ